MLWRRKWLFALPATVILAVVAAVIMMLPPKYSSEAVIFIEDQNIPEDLVPSLMSDYIDRRLSMLSQRVLMRGNLLEIIDNYDLYEDEWATMSRRMLADRMREDIVVFPVSTEVRDPQSGRRSEVTIAFKIRFIYTDPQTAQRITSELVSAYLATNLEVRRDVAEQTTSFFAEERKRVERRIADIEERLTRFQEENRELLPEEIAFSRQLLSNVEQQLTTVDRDLRALKERESFLTTQLALTEEFQLREGRATATPETELELLRAELATARARYSSSHPDVRRLAREVRSLEGVVGQRSGVTALLDREAALSAELAQLRQRYTDDHPDVVRVQRQLASVRESIDTAGGSGQTQPGGSVERNPAFVQLKSQLNSVQTELRSVAEQREQLRQERLELQERLARAPAVEREYTRLSRDLENAIADRDILADKEASAQLSRSLETEAVGERLVLAEPATLPEFPTSPNKKLILAIGLVLSMGSGGASVVLGELLDRRIRSAGDLVAILGDTPLVQLPSLLNAADHRRIWIRRIVILLAIAGVVAGSLWWIDRAVMPLDVLMLQTQSQLEALWSRTFPTAGSALDGAS